MRIACYGFVERDAGSVASADFLLLRELLERGHEVDFYAIRNFVHPEQLFGLPNFHYHGVLLEGHHRFRQKLRGLGTTGERLVGNVSYAAHLRAICRAVAADHAARPYDVLLFLGVGAQFAVRGLTTVSWLQGPPQTEWEAIRALRAQILDLAGPALYVKLKVFYAFKRRAALREIARSDAVICGSAWARAKVIEAGVAPARVFALPYPIDTDLFTPEGPEVRLGVRKTFLWLGRIDPRKRLDLMLDAFAMLARERPDVYLDIHGRLNYAPQYRRLIDAFPFPDRLRFTEGVPRQFIPGLLRGAVAVVQPSESENFGSAVAEGLCCGTPPILGPTNGTGDFIGDAGFRFDAYTPDALADAMRRCLAAVEADEAAVVARARAVGVDAFAVGHVTAALEACIEGAQGLARVASPPAPVRPVPVST